MLKENIKKHKTLIVLLLLLIVVLISAAIFLPGKIKRVIAENTSWQDNPAVAIISGVDFENEVLTDDVNAGSGFVFEILPPENPNNPYGSALVMTTAHNINSDNIMLVLSDNSIRSAELVYRDGNLDIAILSVPEVSPWNKAYTIAETDSLKISDDIYCICSPKTAYLNNTRLEGKITNLNVNGISNQYLIMTDLPLSPGCSGSPILNKKGQVIGMNAFKSTEFGTEGMSFAISSEKLLKAVDNYKNGIVPLDYGIELTPSITAQYRNPAPAGLQGSFLTVKSISETSVFKDILQIGDGIQSVNNTLVYTTADFYENLTSDAVLFIKRGDEYLQLKCN